MAGHLIESIRRVGRTAVGRSIGRAAYRSVAEGAGRWLLTLPNVRSVYATGSLESTWLAPGYSDIDLVLLVDLENLGDELQLRMQLRTRLARLNRFGALFRDVDYVDVRDLPMLQRYPDSWALDLHERWIRLAGPEQRPEPPASTASDRQLLPLFDLVRRWFKASSYLLDPSAERDPVIERRAVQRLLGDALAVLADVDRHAPLESLLAHAPSAAMRERGALDHVCSDWANGRQGRTETHTLVAATLEVIHYLAAVVACDWKCEWPEGRSETAVVDSARQGLEPFALDALRAGFVGVDLLPDSDEGAMCLVTAPPSSAIEAVELMQRLLARRPHLPRRIFRWVSRPILLTPTLWQLAALFPPSPCAAAALAQGDCGHWGEPRPKFSRPNDEDWEHLLRARLLQQFRRVRNRSFRRGKGPEREAAESRIASRLAGVLGGAPQGVSGHPRSPRTEAELIGHHRCVMNAWRGHLGNVGKRGKSASSDGGKKWGLKP
jgi:hypothetical protein